jgi:tetratricopeptide (TPR) repeat protein
MRTQGEVGDEMTDTPSGLKQAATAIRAGDRLAREGDFAGAARTYREMAPAEAPVELVARLGLALLAVDAEQAVAILDRAVRAVSPLDEEDDLHWRLEAGRAWGLALLDEDYEAVRVCRDALARLRDRSGFGAARALLRGTLGMALYYQGGVDQALPHLDSARAGWGARGDESGVVLIDQVRVGMPRRAITPVWLHAAMAPLLAETAD